MIPDVSLDAYDAARHRAAVIDRSDRGRLVVSGADRASYLHGLFTNDIASIGPGRGVYTAYLTAQGRMIADLWVYELGDAILLMMDGSVRETVLAKLDQFIFTEDVQLGDVTATFAQIGVIGPDAARTVSAAVHAPVEAVAALGEHGNLRVPFGSGSAIVTRITDTGEPGYDLYVERADAAAVLASCRASGAADLDPGTADAIRIERGVPRFHRDMDEDTIPLEAGIESTAISFTKGCYVGQEVIVRVLHRGHGRIARKLMGLSMAGERVPDPGAVVRSGEREVGRITSAAFSPALRTPVALASLHRDFLEPGTAVTVDGAIAATVVALPFVEPRALA